MAFNIKTLFREPETNISGMALDQEQLQADLIEKFQLEPDLARNISLHISHNLPLMVKVDKLAFEKGRDLRVYCPPRDLPQERSRTNMFEVLIDEISEEIVSEIELPKLSSSQAGEEVVVKMKVNVGFLKHCENFNNKEEE